MGWTIFKSSGKITKNNKLKTVGKIAKVAFGENIELDTILRYS